MGGGSSPDMQNAPILSVIIISLCIYVVYMAKLYWRLKKNGRWTWKPAQVTEVERRIDPDNNIPALLAVIYLEEEQ